MLRRNAELIRRLLQSAAFGTFSVLNISEKEIEGIDALFARYMDLSPQLADLALLHLAQRENIDTVFTLDRRDFGVFRLKGKRHLRLIPEIE